MVGLMGTGAGETVLELGAGSGIFTKALCRSFAHVLALEIDDSMMKQLHEKLDGEDNVQILESDMLTFNPVNHVPPLSRLAGNLPYDISGPMVARIVTWQTLFQDAHLMLQKEMAERLLAPVHTRARGRLTVMVELRCNIKMLLRLSPGAFRPPPKVESAFIRLVFKPDDLTVDWKALEGLLRQCFNTRRKKAAGAIAGFFGLGKAETIARMKDKGVDPDCRPEDFTAESWLTLLTLKDK